MADYTKTTNFTSKDSLPTGNPSKIVAGSEHDTEYDNIATAIATKTNKAVPSGTNNVAVLGATGDLVDLGSTMLNAIYPVGAIYLSTANTSPSAIIGGTWTAIQTGRVLLSEDAGVTYTAGDTGGSADSIVVAHTHTAGSLASDSNGAHTHGIDKLGGGAPNTNVVQSGTAESSGDVTTLSSGAHTHTISGTTDSTGSSGTGANIQPYLAVYMWERTA